ncbi:UDP-N-acetylmuramoylalanyl-D-glutamate--2, 6-diaminopimelate ligase [Neoasaia chiangmaiensis NBRC 101099]|uniref:UDP-N-acetylmuramoyl-L-alanyl-D-glutamate--2,6-diaminopimelate ligase n=1 Tax=Neoasaia chiangmaiensis TaxID=320497 RepID=A0A1U9KSU8_9PROT|nr:UDP-N-acetylmuramoyl-L-alanyl-D-glutamate--2,6-diaminopimelate ligase [Neoasaia chiangmaiensis]AQS88896.1 UDP-N-acetylmuramoyl-L-alanyl-D-glutamate--2,6-diaminopimelate ligase [Neoasaia chiangmaiensis]GBR40464.1 UDP-N-acetylmuramoylalanyl-D-glutamate--2, 6-diaminopimelate ligase [Neoasaia chiangmaiensis NBRC 101099]GEN13887.1 UDP-N-acetylmuramoyl-L-alanyl-D-glutamate--2,6-diaminopimelate ligase [Neoasaia chiangmaiensis]
MKLSSLLAAANLTLPAGAADPVISGITADSRQVRPGFIFAALSGQVADGAHYIHDAVTKGALAVLGTQVLPASPSIAIETSQPRQALALISARLAGSQPARIAAITGTNGKSSTADFVRQIWHAQGHPAASLGTLGLISDRAVPPPPPLTTPDPVALSQTLAALAKAGVDHVALEASSHGLDQHRLDGVAVTAAGFCNLTRDHLDYHLTLEAYRAAKLRLFDNILPSGGISAINTDMDAATVTALRNIAARRMHRLRTVGMQAGTLQLLSARPLPEGQVLSLALFGEKLPDITLALPGRFQADNVMLAAALAWENDDQARGVIDILSRLQGVRGRCERAFARADGAAAYVDYAHTPDALERLLTSLRPHATGRLVAIFGAGGDRDRGKRPLMGAVAARLADIAIVTDDNPRSEDPAAIRREVRSGCPNAIEIGDRRAAIAAGLDMLRPGDVLVVAGKGHELGQTVAGIVHPFDDRAVIREVAGIAA